MADVETKPEENVKSDKEEQPKEKVEENGKEKTAEANGKTENGTDDKKAEESKPEKADESKPEKADESKPEKADEAEKSAEGDDLSKLESGIIRQVEYYFGDANLGRDKFLMGQIQKDNDGWVPISVLMTFKRLAALSTDVEVVVDSLLKSEEGLLEISEDRTKIRRHPERPIPEHNEEHRKEVMSRTAYVKGFPLDANIDEILEYFTPHNKVLNVTMRKYYDKADKKYKFKGSVFVTFENKDQVQTFLDKEDLSYKGRTLVRKWQDKYLVEKREEREQIRALKEKKKNKAKKPEEKKIELPKGTVLHFEGVDSEIKREILREAIEKLDGDLKVAYIEFNKGDKEGHIRFQDEGNAAKLLEKLEDNKLKVNDEVEITLQSLSEEKETEFLAKVVEDMKKTRNNAHKKGNDRGGNRKRRFGNFNNGKGKKQKLNDDE